MKHNKMNIFVIPLLFVCVSTFYMMGSVSGFVLGPTTPGKWGAPAFGTPGGTVTWSLMGDGITIDEDDGVPPPDFIGVSTALSSFMPAGFKPLIVSAFSAWSAVANIQFVEVPDLGEPFNAAGSSGDIRIGGHTFDGAGGTLAHGFFPPVNGLTAAGDIHFDIDENWVIGFPGPGFDIFQVAAHEIGHAIGLSHEDTAALALMDPFYTEAFSGLLADDIAGAQFIYGTNVVPEPCTITLLGIGIIGILVYGWRQRKH